MAEIITTVVLRNEEINALTIVDRLLNTLDEAGLVYRDNETNDFIWHVETLRKDDRVKFNGIDYIKNDNEKN